MTKKNYIEFPNISFWLEENDVIAFKYGSNLNIDLPMAKELVENRLEYCDNKPSYCLIDFTNVKSVTKEAREYMNDPNGGLRCILGGAFLSSNSVGNLFINVYLKINKPIIPARFFNNREEALRWLKKLSQGA